MGWRGWGSSTPHLERFREVAHGAILRDKLMRMFLAGELTASLLVELSILITQAGAHGLEDLGDHLSSTKNAARRVARLAGLDVIKEECIQTFNVPQRGKKSQMAKPQPMAFVPFHEALSRSFARYPEEFLKHVREPESLAENFYKHPSVREFGADRCIPLRLFVDGAKLDEQASQINISMAPPLRPLHSHGSQL